MGQRRVIIVEDAPVSPWLWVVILEAFVLCVVLMAMMLEANHWLGELALKLEDMAIPFHIP